MTASAAVTTPMRTRTTGETQQGYGGDAGEQAEEEAPADLGSRAGLLGVFGGL